MSETIDARPFKQEGRGRNAAKRYHKTEEIPSNRDHIDHPGGGATYEFQSIPDNPLGEDEYNSDEDVNINRVGLPAVERFYNKYKSIERNIEFDKDKRQAPVAYL